MYIHIHNILHNLNDKLVCYFEENFIRMQLDIIKLARYILLYIWVPLLQAASMEFLLENCKQCLNFLAGLSILYLAPNGRKERVSAILQ